MLLRAGRPSVPVFRTLFDKNAFQTIRFYATPLEVRPGTIVHQLILPLGIQKYSFPLRPSDSLRQLLHDIRTEKPSINQIFATDQNGQRIPQTTSVSTLLKNGFSLQIDTDKYEVSPSQKNTSESILTASDVQDMCKKVYHQNIRKRIAEETRHHISYTEFESWCFEYALSSEQAKKLALSLHHVGDILYFPDNPTLKPYIFLSPTYIAGDISKAINLKFMKNGYSEVLHELESILPEYLELNHKKLEYDRVALASADRRMKLIGTYLVVQFAVLARMVWVDFNWDIMEPVTYFVTLGGTIVGYLFFVLFKAEYTYMALKEREFNKKLRKLYLKNEFPWPRWNELDQKVHSLVRDIGPANAPTQLQHAWNPSKQALSE